MLKLIPEGQEIIETEIIPEVLQEEKKKPRKKKVEQEDLLLLSKVLSAGTNESPKNIIRTELEKELIKHNLTTNSALETISSVMHHSRKETNRIIAAKIALELNGVMKNQEVSDNSQVVQFIFNDQVDLNGVFNPKR